MPKLLQEQRLNERAEKEAAFFGRFRNQRLTRLIQYAYARCAYYQQRYDERTVRSFRRVEDLAGLPMVSKRDLQDGIHNFVAAGSPIGDSIWRETSGSTGEPLGVLKDLNSIWFSHLRLRLAAQRFGVEIRFHPFRTSVVRFSGFENPETARVLIPALNMSRLFQIGIGESVWNAPRDLLRFLSPLRSYVLSSDPASLMKLLRYCREHDPHGGLPIRPSLIVSTSRPLLDSTRGDLESFFGCRIADLYSMTEVGGIALQCPMNDGYHVEGLSVVVECVRTDGTIAAPGEIGELVVTGLLNPVCCLIRYRTGDMGCLVDEPCECGSVFPRLGKLILRAGVLFVRNDGTKFEPPLLVRGISTLPVHQYQIEQVGIDRFILRYVPTNSLAKNEVVNRAPGIFNEVLRSKVSLECKSHLRIGEPGRKVQPFVCRMGS